MKTPTWLLTKLYMDQKFCDLYVSETIPKRPHHKLVYNFTELLSHHNIKGILVLDKKKKKNLSITEIYHFLYQTMGWYQTTYLLG